MELGGLPASIQGIYGSKSIHDPIESPISFDSASNECYVDTSASKNYTFYILFRTDAGLSRVFYNFTEIRVSVSCGSEFGNRLEPLQLEYSKADLPTLIPYS